MTALEPLLLIPGAFLAGVLMFLAPCTLPIVPGYLVFISGGEKKVMRNALAFVLGFSVVFIVLGTFAGLIGSVIGPWQDILSKIAGVLIILFGFTMLGVFRLPIIGSEWHTRIPKFLVLGRWESSALIGVLFALGWSPCIGPILGTILLFASTSATALQGAILLAVFSFGLAIPFLLCALFIDKIGNTFARFGRATQILSFIGGIVLVFLGLLMLSGSMGALVLWGFQFFDFLGYDRLLKYL
ncbi:sulfite exporter TauE/SafE family protein [Acetobacteraceae bacterium]|nr:sulfite exporter TauE/SafE family protein [Candidatus Parcubacteria bacterium]